MIKLCMLLYADDTVLIAESIEQLQVSLNCMHRYCDQNKLVVNSDKTKVMVFSRGKITNIPVLYTMEIISWM